MRGATGGDLFKSQLAGDESSVPEGLLTMRLKCN